MVLGLGTMVSNMMVEGGKSPLFGSPKDMDLDFEQVEFTNKDEKTLRGWLILPSSKTTKKVIVQSHFGVQSCRSGYTPEGKGMMAPYPNEINFLKAVPHYLEQGYAVLMYDMTNHGESDAGKCEYVSWGPFEAQDVAAAVEFCSNFSREGDPLFESIYMLSICMGAASTTYAYGQDLFSKVSRDKMKAMVAVQPLTYAQMVTNLGMPSFLNAWSEPVTTQRLGFNLNEKSFYADVDKIAIPTLVIQNNNDPFHKHEEVQEFYDKLTVTKDILWLDDLEKNRFAGYQWLTQNPEKVTEWFNKYEN